VTTHYRPPELLLGKDIVHPKMDVWSAGCVVMEMLHKEYTFWCKTDDPYISDEQNVWNNIVKKLGPVDTDSELKTFPRWKKLNPRNKSNGPKTYEVDLTSENESRKWHHLDDSSQTFIGLGSIPRKWNDLVRLMLTLEPSKRLSSASILKKLQV
jgi:serine/threonine protein kinase